ncbi:ABC transporter ATP-binding protein [Pseudomonas sp. dw_358]|uniref:ABC transporter ATP-binding protein n=1 Tax=Pseudomonas sp. dw_358 TaxID=2720083 RepID=UPI001BD65381|nr:ABC transporter ATP-binding protein [Pseudomonas sp. dw_358]
MERTLQRRDQPVTAALATPALELAGLGKRYGDLKVVGDVSLTVPKGALLTLLGPSGCGKSTLLRMIAGFIRPDTGRVLIGGQDVTAQPPERRPSAMVFQSYALFPHMSVFDNVAFGLRLRKLGTEALRAKVQAALALVRMDSFGQRYPAELSGGQQQRVALARGLVIEPQLLLLDEPFGALDRHLREEMQVELRKLQRQLGITMLVVTHDQDEAFILSDYVAVMNSGHIEQFAAPAQLYDHPASCFVARFMGIPNLLPGFVGQSQGRTVFRHAGDGCLSLEHDGGAIAGDPVHLALRPETLRLVAPADVDADLVGTLAFITLIGSRLQYEVDLGWTSVHVVMPRTEDSLQVGQRVGVAINRRLAIVLTA